MKKIIGLSFLLIFASFVYGQDNNYYPISYELIGGKMRIQVRVGEANEYFIFDTGGRTTITGELSRRLGIQITGTKKVTDVTSTDVSMSTGIIDQMSLAGGTIILKNIPVMILDEDELFNCYGCTGLIGSDVFSQNVIEIDSRKKEIKFYNTPSFPNPAPSIRNAVKFVHEYGIIPVLKLGISDGKTLNVLFDTGSKSFFTLKQDDFEFLKDSDAFIEEQQGESISSIGVAGVASVSPISKINLPLLTMGTSKFRNISTQTEKSLISLIGTEILEYGTVLIDYPNKRFYFEPFETLPAKIHKKSWNIELTAKDGRLQIAALWGDMLSGLKIGDEVTEIDGISIDNIDFCESITNGLKLLQGKESATIKIHSGNEIKVVNITKE